jgi:hypothetical protein
MRTARLTSGENSFSSKNLITNTTGIIIGISLVAEESSDESKDAFCKDNTRWTISFNIMCNESETGALSYDKFSFTKDSDKCTLEFNTFHNAGCSTLKPSGITQLISSSYFFAVLIFIAGFPTCFLAIKLIDYLNIIVPSILAFILVSVLFSIFGFDSVFEEDNEITGQGIIMAILSFVMSLVACIVVGY